MLVSLVVLAATFVFAIRWLVKTSKPSKEQDDIQSPFADEELLEMFQYLSISDLVSCAAACKQFNRVAKDEKLWLAFCQRDFPQLLTPKQTKERPVWLPNWQDYYIYHFRYMTSFNVAGVVKIYWKMMRKHGHQGTICFLSFLPLLLGLLMIAVAHYSSPAVAPTLLTTSSSSFTTTSTQFTEAETAVQTLDKLTQLPLQQEEKREWEIPNCNGETCVWLILIAVAVSILVYIIIPVISFLLSLIEPVFIYVGLRLFGGYDEEIWKDWEEHKNTTILLGATLVSAVLFTIVLSLAIWRIFRFGLLNYKSRREKFVARLKLNWNEFKQSRSMRRRLRAIQERIQRQVKSRTNNAVNQPAPV
jgi:hypothetical protein